MMKVKDIGMTFVKCTRFLSVDTARIEMHGIDGDREFILLDQHGAPMPPHHHGLFAPLAFSFDPTSARLTLTFPDGRTVEGSGAGSSATMALDYMGMRTINVRDIDGNWNQILTEHVGRPVRMVRSVRAGGGIDVLPITLFTTASLRILSEKLGQAVDARRFRANLVIDHDQPFAEDSWEGCTLRIGDALLRVRSGVPRCVVTQCDPETGENDMAVVPALGKFRNRVQLPDGLMPHYCTPAFAAYAEVLEPGIVQRGDQVQLTDRPH
ncbi:MOSC domain-containing protein [Sphingobium agri]|uniref:MOSC domain-containing protein n=1 Tax=Sphingobium agri TaxID=2933566 RepID=A0ABT0DZN2_9SPHN|nr:MOSC domain-containing protein [Sphingobium agri]MCK0532584.1 MOSC domain-containing protein [Sphingobium agri]